VIVGPSGNEIKIGVGIEALQEFTPLVKDEGFQRGFDFIPGKFVLLLFASIGHAHFHVVERNEGFV
jgi:hypothetical protein